MNEGVFHGMHYISLRNSFPGPGTMLSASHSLSHVILLTMAGRCNYFSHFYCGGIRDLEKVNKLLKVTEGVLVKVGLSPGLSDCTVRVPDPGQPPDGGWEGRPSHTRLGLAGLPLMFPLRASHPLPCTGS